MTGFPELRLYKVVKLSETHSNLVYQPEQVREWAKCLADCLTMKWKQLQEERPEIAEAFTNFILKEYTAEQNENCWNCPNILKKFVVGELLRVAGEKEAKKT